MIPRGVLFWLECVIRELVHRLFPSSLFKLLHSSAMSFQTTEAERLPTTKLRPRFRRTLQIIVSARLLPLNSENLGATNERTDDWIGISLSLYIRKLIECDLRRNMGFKILCSVYRLCIHSKHLKPFDCSLTATSECLKSNDPDKEFVSWSFRRCNQNERRNTYY